MRHNTYLSRMEESHGVKEFRKFVNSDRTAVCQHTVDPLGRMFCVCKLHFQYGIGKSDDVRFGKNFRSLSAPGWAGMSAWSVFFDQGHLRVEGDPNVVTRGKLERASIVTGANKRLQGEGFYQLVNFKRKCMHRFYSFQIFVLLTVLFRQQTEMLTKVILTLHEPKHFFLLNRETVLRTGFIEPRFVVNLSLNKDLLVGRTLVVTVPSKTN